MQPETLIRTFIEEAFNKRDRREGHRLERQLEQVRKSIDHLYEKWMALTTD